MTTEIEINGPFTIVNRNGKMILQVQTPDGVVEQPKPAPTPAKSGRYVVVIKERAWIPGETSPKYVKGHGYVPDQTEAIPGELENMRLRYGATGYVCVSESGRVYQFEFNDVDKAQAFYVWLNGLTCYMAGLPITPLPECKPTNPVPDSLCGFRPDDIALITNTPKPQITAVKNENQLAQ